LFALSTFGVTAESINEEHESLIREIIDNDDHDPEIFSNYLRQRLPSSFCEKDIQLFAAFLRSMLQTNPRQRISSARLLRHPWLPEELRRQGSNSSTQLPSQFTWNGRLECCLLE
jgi:serine/threonine protein kinase